MTTMIQSGLDITPVITHQFSYRQFEEAFQLMKTGHLERSFSIGAMFKKLSVREEVVSASCQLPVLGSLVKGWVGWVEKSRFNN